MPSNILVIDNDEAILDLLDELLTEAGYHVTAQDYLPHDAAQLLAPNSNLAILDYGQGRARAAITMLRTQVTMSSIPVIISSADFHAAEQLTDLLPGGRVELLLKPFDIDVLLALVARLLSAAGD